MGLIFDSFSTLPTATIRVINFLFVLNGEAVHGYMSVIDWKEIKIGIPPDYCSAIYISTVWQASGNYANYDFVHHKNRDQNESTIGHAMPAMKPNSKVPQIIDVLVPLTSFDMNTPLLWRPIEDHFALIDEDSLSEFAHKIEE
jgi:hypothetical protein